MENGVTFLDDASTLIDSGVKIGRDTILGPSIHLVGETTIGEGCVIQGASRIVDSTVADGAVIDSSVVEKSVVGSGVTMGPYAHLRPNCVLEENVHIGNFVEVKNSHIGKGTKAGHLAYIGDGDVGENVNISCGVIFAITTARKNSAPPSATMPLSAPMSIWWLPSPSAKAPLSPPEARCRKMWKTEVWQ